MAKLRSICVFCGSRPGNNPDHAEMARQAGQLIAEKGIRLVFGGGALGLMGITAEACKSAGGDVLGVIPEFLIPLEGTVDDIELRKVATMGSRKAMMITEADGFLILPGGTGTLEEVFDVLTRRSLGLETKPVAFVDHDYWAPMEMLLKHACQHGYTEPGLIEGFSFETSVDAGIETLLSQMQTDQD